MNFDKILAITSVAGLFAGPIVAVLISMWIEERRQRRFRQLAAARGLVMGRLNIADPAFQLAINTVPIDFADDENVLSAWEAYMEAVSKQPADDPRVHEGWMAAQRELTKAVLVAIGYKDRAASQIVRNPYISTAYAESLQRQDSALKAVVELARNTDRLATVNERLMAAAEQQAQAASPPQPK